MQNYRFFIFDCHGQIVGNPKGYRTHKGASRQAHTRSLQDLIWQRFYNRTDKSTTRVWEIYSLGV